jgi:RNA polymerase sigma-70 factor (ECF subfamily)
MSYPNLMRNSRKIFSQIYDRYIDKIYRFIFLKVNSQEITQDLTSETFLRGWESFKNGNKIENPQAFLYKIARNLVIDHYREKGKTKIISAEYVKITDPRTNLEEKALLNSDLDNIKTALTNLKEDYQNVIIWRYLDDLPIPEIAKIMDKSEEAIRVQLHRALKALKNELK